MDHKGHEDLIQQDAPIYKHIDIWINNVQSSINYLYCKVCFKNFELVVISYNYKSSE